MAAGWGCLAFAQNWPELYRAEIHRTLTKIQDSQLTSNPRGFWNQTRIEELKARLREIQFIEVEELVKPKGAGRSSAFHDPDGKTIYINARNQPPLDFLPTISLHEFFGAVKIGDFFYQNSVGIVLFLEESGKTWADRADQRRNQKSLTTVINSRTSAQTDALRRKGIDLNDPNNYLMAKGGDIIGGGGDGEEIALKTLLMTTLNATTALHAERGAHLSYLFAYVLGIPVELTDGQAIEYVPGTERHSIMRSIRVPRAMARKSLTSKSPAQDSAIRDIIYFWRTYIHGSDIHGIPVTGKSCNDPLAFGKKNFLGIHPAAAKIWRNTIAAGTHMYVYSQDGKGCK